MHYGLPNINTQLEPLSKFFKEMGLNETEILPSLKITGTSNLPEETRVYVLGHQ